MPVTSERWSARPKTGVFAVAALFLTGTAAAACPPAFQAATELRITLERADAVWRGEADGALGMAEVVRNAVGCAPAPMEPHDAARVHRTMGLAAAIGGDIDRARRLFAVARGIEPDVPAPARTVGGDEAIEAYRTATALPPLPPEDGLWRVDGVARAEPTSDRPSVTQRVDGDAIRGTVWLDAGDPIPLSVACDEPTTRRGFTDDLLAAEQSLARSEPDALAERVQRAEATLDCLPDALSSNEAAQLLRLTGASLWVSGPDQQDQALPWLAAARALQPRYQFPSTTLPLDHPLSVAVTETVGEPVVTSELPAARGMLLVNGEPASTAPANRPWVLQHVENGQATLGALVRPGEPIPSWPAPLRSPVTPEAPPRRSLGTPTVATYIAASTLVAIGSGLWGGANHSIYRYCPGPDRGCPGDLGQRATTQRGIGVVMVGVGVGLGGLGAGLTVGDLRE